ncbi:MAG: T9SS type A sorting domain-containing protein [Taibaiella sp.]|nr:T9SS type A sorting domain-containing protein [Taibaiella sp.]
MKRMLLASLPIVTLVAVSASLDLGNMANYQSQAIPGYISKDNTPLNNEITDKGATLGRVLFYDKKLSVNNTKSCASCHKQQFAFGDTASASEGVNGTTGRHSMRLVNARFANEARFFWDERAATLEEQTTRPIQDHAEMGYSGQNGDPNITDLVAKMNGTWYYPELFTWVYGDAQITENRIQLALAQFIRSIQSFDAKYDAGIAQTGNPNGPFPNFTQQENQGKGLFTQPPVFDANGVRVGGGAGCAGCHRSPEFDIAPTSRNNGIIGSFTQPNDITNTRAPSLRDVVDANGNPYGGFMHTAGQNGLSTLLDVINHYDSIPQDNPNLDPRLRPGGNLQRLRLSIQEKANLVAFLRTLTGSNIYTNPKWSDPFTDDSLTIIPEPVYVQPAVATAIVKVYPTVTTGRVIVEYPSALTHTRMLVADMNGRVIVNGHIAGSIDLSAQPAGMYFARFENGQTVKIVKQ